MTTLTPEERAAAYAELRGSEILPRRLGFGNDGSIWVTTRKSAVKIFARADSYARERNAYLRLRANNVREICRVSVPELVDYSDQWLVVEMSIVSPPFLLDFGKAHLDAPPDYSVESLQDWEAARRELFGEDWPTVARILRALRAFGIFYFDATPGNIVLR